MAHMLLFAGCVCGAANDVLLFVDHADALLPAALDQSTAPPKELEDCVCGIEGRMG